MRRWRGSVAPREPEQHLVTASDYVLGHAGALGADAAGAGETQLAGAQSLDPDLVEVPGTPGLRGEPVVQHRVRVLVASGAYSVPLLVPWWMWVRCRQLPPFVGAGTSFVRSPAAGSA
ncbi:hypothetical protein GCM10018966_025680 [Streptomyces yanii]